MSRQDNEQANNLSRNMKSGVVTKNQRLTIEMVLRHGIEVTTKTLLRGKKNVVTTNINIAGNRIDIAT